MNYSERLRRAASQKAAIEARDLVLSGPDCPAKEFLLRLLEKEDKRNEEQAKCSRPAAKPVFSVPSEPENLSSILSHSGAVLDEDSRKPAECITRGYNGDGLSIHEIEETLPF